MRYKLAILFSFFALSGSAQIVKTAGIPYTATTPSHTPSASGSAWAIDTANLDLYAYYGGAWNLAGERIQTISGCAAPAYTPGKGQSVFVINGCDSLYYYRSGAWVIINAGGGGGGGGVSDGDKGDIDVSASGTVWTIDTSAVTNIKVDNNAIDSTKVGDKTLSLSDLNGSWGVQNGSVLKWNGTNWRPGSDNTGADGNGIYSGNGDIPTATAATIPLQSYFKFDWWSGNDALLFDDFGDSTSLYDPTGASAVLLTATKLGLRSTGNIELWGGTGGAKLRMLEPTGSGTNYTQIQVGAQSADITYTLPATTGTDGQYLQFTTGGQLQWSTVAAGVTDGDKGDIDVTGTGATWTVDTSAISRVKIAADAIDSTKVEDLRLSLSDLNGGWGVQNGSVLKWNGTNWRPATDTDTDAQTLSIDSAIVGNVERFSVAISSGNTVNFDVPQVAGVTDGDKGDIDVTASGATWTIDTGAVTTGKILDGTILFEDFGQNGASNGQVIKWNGTAWAAAADNTGGAGSTDLSWTGASSPYILNSSSGTDVAFAQGTGITLSTTDSTLTITNSSPDQTVAITGAGISVVTGTYPNFTVTSTEVDGSTTNEIQNLTLSGQSLGISSGTGVTLPVVGVSAGTGISVSSSSGTVTVTNAAPDQTVAITGAGISTVTGTYPNFTVTSTESDGSASNEGILGVGAGSGTTATITTNTTTGSAVTIAGGGIVAITETTSSNGGTITITATEVDGSTTNEIQDLSLSGQTLSLSSDATTVTLPVIAVSAGTGISTSSSGGTVTVTNSAPDQTVAITGAGISAVTGTYPNFTITSTEVDGSTTNEIQNLSLSGQSLGISSGTGVTLPVVGVSAGTGISVSSSSGTVTVTNSAPDQTVSITGAGISAVTGTYPNFTVTSTEVDGSTTNELQTIANTSDATSHTVTLSNSGGSVQLIEGAGISLSTGGSSSAGTVTIAATNSGTVTSVGITAPAAGITVSNSPITSSGNITLALADDLAAVEGLSTNGIAVRTATNTWATRSIAVSADAASTAALSIGFPDGISGNPTINVRTSASSVKLNALVATTGNITLSGTQSIDGINLFANNRVLVKNQNTASENGIWVVSSGAWSRATDLDVNDELNGGVIVYIKRGTANGGKYFRLTTSSEPEMTINSTALTFSEIFDGFTLTDGDKGDIDVTSSGATWTVDTNAITTGKIANATILLEDIAANGASAGQIIKYDGSAWVIANDSIGGGGAGVTDGDKGDITVSGSGATWTIDADVVDSTNVGSKALSLNDLNGEWGAAAGTPLEWNGTNWRPGVDSSGIYSGSGNVPDNTIPNVLGYFGFQYDTGDGEAIGISNSGGTVRISSPDANTYALVENDSLTIESDTKVKIVANTLDASGVTNFIGFPSGGGVTDGDKGDIDVTGSGATWTVDTSAINTVKIADGAVTLAKIQNISGNSILARTASGSGSLSQVALSASNLVGRGSTGNVSAISLGSNLSMSGSALNTTGHPTISGTPTANTIPKWTSASQLGSSLITDDGTLVAVGGTTGIVVPNGTTLQRPALPDDNGIVRYNSTTGALEYYKPGGWEAPLLSATGTGLDTAGRVLFADANGRAAGAANIQYDGTTGNVGFFAAPSSARKIDIQTGTLTGNDVGFYYDSTIPATPTAANNNFDIQVTSNGSASFPQRAVNILLRAGYTGSNQTMPIAATNQSAGTGSDVTGNANFGLNSASLATTTGTNCGSRFTASNGNKNYGILSRAVANKVDALNVGVLGLGLNTSGTTPISVGGFFGLQTAEPTYTSAALIADNGAQSSPIFLARDNGTVSFRIDDGGKVTVNGTTAGDNTLQVNGSLGRKTPVTVTSTPYSVLSDDTWIIVDRSSSTTITLPSAADWDGREITIKTIQAQTVISGSSNVVPIDSGTAGTAILPATDGAWALLVSNGTNWVIMQRG